MVSNLLGEAPRLAPLPGQRELSAEEAAESERRLRQTHTDRAKDVRANWVSPLTAGPRTRLGSRNRHGSTKGKPSGSSPA
ncbi:hypothetical protein [Streptomyces ardesiacus]